jgi:hypothetical protein
MRKNRVIRGVALPGQQKPRIRRRRDDPKNDRPTLSNLVLLCGTEKIQKEEKKA